MSRLGVREFRHFLREAPIGARLVYHIGFLARDRDPETNPRESIEEIEVLDTFVRNAHAEKAIALFQKRLGPNCFSYIAVKLRSLAL